MKICFISTSHRIFDVSTPEREALGGTESCIAYLAVALAGSHSVTLMVPNVAAGVVRSVRHVDLTRTVAATFFEHERFDVIVVVNSVETASLLRAFSPASRVVFWNHHAPDQPAVQLLARAETAAALDAVVYVSEWQRAETVSRLGSLCASRVIGNGLTPAFENMFRNSGELLAAKERRAAYTSIPSRGLDVLVEAWSELTDPPLLDVFSSMQVYGGDEAPFRQLYERARSNRFITYHGSVSQIQLASAMRRVSFLSYPCTFAETFCIAALEAMAAGATVVSTAFGALPWTTLGFAELLPFAGISTRRELAAKYGEFFRNTVDRAMSSKEQWAERMFEQVTLVNRDHVWRRRAVEWERLFSELLQSPVTTRGRG
jgi:glycosyltransferase involved in cell wall biosynthesis